MRCGLNTVGVSVSPTPYGLNSIEVEPSACGTGIGTSPPARKLALCPDRATSVGSASTRARLLLSSRLRFANSPCVAELKIRLNADDIGVVAVVCGCCPAVAATEGIADGANEPN